MATARAAERPATVELFAITPGRGDAHELRDKIPALAAGGVGRLLLREKQLSVRARGALGVAVAEACRAAGMELWVSEEVGLAQELGARGVQLSERSAAPADVAAAVAPGLALGVSLHAPVSRGAADLAVCHHAFLAPLFATPAKSGVVPLEIEGFAALAAQLPTRLPLYALGGITWERLDQLAAAGIRRVAAIRLFFDAVDPARAAAVVLERLRAGAPPPAGVKGDG